MKLEYYGEEYDLGGRLFRYEGDGNMAIELHDKNTGEPFASLIHNFYKLEGNVGFVKIDSISETIIKTHNLGKSLGKYLRSGFNLYVLYEFDLLKTVENYKDYHYFYQVDEAILWISFIDGNPIVKRICPQSMEITDYQGDFKKETGYSSFLEFMREVPPFYMDSKWKEVETELLISYLS